MPAQITLNDGATIPQLGLGVWQVDHGITAQVVGWAIKAGYRLIDTAEGYQNEEGVGEAIRAAAVPRRELFITSKLRNGAHQRDAALRAFDETMEKLGVEQIDLFLIHWPVPSRDRYVEAWKTLIELKQAGRTSQMVRGIDELVSHVSMAMTLLPGDVILTGTPAGVGPLTIGDEVSVTIEQVGTLTNRVVARG